MPKKRYPYPIVKWNEQERKNSSYMGRNGSGKCMGVEVFHTPGHFITLQPLNSKDTLGTCCIQIPESHISEVCNLMEGSLLDLVLTNLKDQLPRLLGLDPTLDERVSDKLKEK
jgi:hypothetical protein